MALPPLGDIGPAPIPAQQFEVLRQQRLAPGGQGFSWEDGKPVVSLILFQGGAWEGPRGGS